MVPHKHGDVFMGKSSLGIGTHTLKVRARDCAGNWSNYSNEVTFTITEPTGNTEPPAGVEPPISVPQQTPTPTETSVGGGDTEVKKYTIPRQIFHNTLQFLVF